MPLAACPQRAGCAPNSLRAHHNDLIKIYLSGESGNQSLTRLAAYIARPRHFTLKKSYNVASLFEDLRGLKLAQLKEK
jgi:hypothetical protein